MKWDKNNFEPRLGFAWSPGENAKTAVRGGYGIFHDVSANGGVQGLVYNPPFFADSGFTSNNIMPVRTLPTGFEVLPRPESRDLSRQPLPARARLPAGHDPDVERQRAARAVRARSSLTVAYAGTRGRDIQSKGWNINSAPPGPGFNTASRRPYPQYNTFNAILGRGTLDHNSLQLKAEKQLSGGLYILAAYTFGKTTTNGAGQNVGVGQGVRYFPYAPIAGCRRGPVGHRRPSRVQPELHLAAADRT